MSRRARRAQRVLQRGHVEDVAQALAIGLEHGGERSVTRRHGEEVGRALALLPQRGARARPASRQQQRPSRDLAELRGEKRAGAQLPHDELLDLVGRRQEQRRIRWLVCFRHAHHEPVVAPHRLDVEAALAAEARDDGEAPGDEHAPAERREDADAPVAELVAAALDDDRAVIGNDAGGGTLIGEVLQEVWRPPSDRDRVAARGDRSRDQVAARVSSRPSLPIATPSSTGTAGHVALPERHLAGLARRRAKRSRGRA